MGIPFMTYLQLNYLDGSSECLASTISSIDTYATSSTTPPASFIFRSASLLKNRAFTTNGISGILPLPKTFE